MSDFESLQSTTSKLFTSMAEKYYPEGSTLRCIPCGKQRHTATSEIANYMRSGFPRCKACGHVTDLVTPRDEAMKR